MITTRRLFAVFGIVMVFAVPVAAHAAPDIFPIVTCGGTTDSGTKQPDCTPCYMFESVSHLINLILYGITGPIAAFMVLVAGGMMLLAGGNPGLYSQGKKLLTNTLIGVAVILLSWVATTFLIKNLAPGSIADSWYTFSCPQFLQDAGTQAALPAPGASTGSPQQPNQALVQANAAVCDQNKLATAYGVPASLTNAPSLVTMMSCIERDPIVLLATVGGGHKFTYEESNPMCNYTRGTRVCGACAHAYGSCHYGGTTGSQGAMAVDYSWNKAKIVFYYQNGNPVKVNDCKEVPAGTPCHSINSNEALFDEIYHSIDQNKCQYKFLNYEGVAGAEHTHVSTVDCSSDGTGVAGRQPANQK